VRHCEKRFRDVKAVIEVQDDDFMKFWWLNGPTLLAIEDANDLGGHGGGGNNFQK